MTLAPPDAGTTNPSPDGGLRADASVAADSGQSQDASVMTDGGQRQDAGGTTDGGLGEEPDAQVADAGNTNPDFDAGPNPTSSTDASTPLGDDAGIRPGASTDAYRVGCIHTPDGVLALFWVLAVLHRRRRVS